MEQSDGACTYSATRDDFPPEVNQTTWEEIRRILRLADGVWECPHERVDGLETCPIHSDPEALPEGFDFDAFLRDALARADGSEPDAYRYAQFVNGRFDSLHLRDPEDAVESTRPDSVAFVGTTVEGPVTIEGGYDRIDVWVSSFGGPVDASGLTVDGNLLFVHSSIDGRCDLDGVTVAGELFCVGTAFDGPVALTDAELGGAATFKHATVDGDVDLARATVAAGVDFDDAAIHGTAALGEATAVGSLSFEDVDVLHGVDCQGTTIRGDVSFERADFGESPIAATVAVTDVDALHDADFRNATVEGDVAFARARLGSAWFTDATIEGGVDFTEAAIDNTFHLAGVTVRGEARLRKIDVYGELYGREGTFTSDVQARTATVDGELDFVNATFEGGLQLSVLHATGNAHFDGVDVGGLADFRNAQFAGRAQFDGARFRDDVRFNAGRDESPLSCARFLGETSFAGVACDGVADFFNVTRFDHPPDFSGADLSGANFENVDLVGAALSDANLTDANLSRADVRYADAESAQFNRAKLTAADFRGARLFGALMGDAHVDERTTFLGPPERDPGFDFTLESIRSTPCCAYDADRLDRWDRASVPEGVSLPEPDHVRAKNVYRMVEELARSNARPILQGQSFVRRQEVQRQQFRNAMGSDDREKRTMATLRWLYASLSRQVFMYGERPWRVVFWSGVVVLLFAVLYPIGGWMVPVLPGGTEGAPMAWHVTLDDGLWDELALLARSTYYSTLTFTTLGFGDFRPRGVGQALTVAETALGAILIALLVHVLGRRAGR